MKIVIAIDSFKGCASSNELAQEIKKGILSVYEECEIIICPISDGGEGMIEAFSSMKETKLISTICSNPLGKKINGKYAVLKDGTAIIEMARASGLELISEDDRNPGITSTYGTGDLIKDAIKKGYRKFIVGIGGSATNDAGVGMLRSLGFRFLNRSGKEVIFAKDLGEIIKIDRSNCLSELEICEFTIACDVNNPLFGENGASYIYASQKGAHGKMIKHLDKQLKHFANIVQKNTDKKFDKYCGAGAAGGLGFGFLAFLNSQLKSGIKIILEHLGLENKIKDADFVITGEGKIDKQSSMGKVLNGVGAICKKQGVPCIALSGNSKQIDLSIHKIGITSVFSVLDSPISLKRAMDKENALNCVRKESEQIFRLIRSCS
ncbi:MAG: glycerate kinase [Desulfobacteraceae bacterium]|nr:glycerate kinase [Desulfobacteraceae bacterium]